jgi:hypothetical protein
MEDGSKKYFLPSELKNAWITTQPGMQLFASWCYDTKPESITPMLRIRAMEILTQSSRIDDWVSHERP